MDGIPVNVDDIDALAQTLDPGSVKDSLDSLVTAMRTAMAIGKSTVSVQVEGSLRETVDAAFEAAAPAVTKLSLNKIGNL